MSDFSDALKAFKQKTYQRTDAVMNGIAEEAYRSIVFGSELTGAPGQPVRDGYLRGSWQMIWEGPKGPVRIVTKLVYAPIIEDGARENGKAITLRSSVGGFHSVKLTVSGMRNIVSHVNAKVQNGA